MSDARRSRAKKLLIASIGVATVSYVGCESGTSGNLIAPPCVANECGGGLPDGGNQGGMGGVGGAGGTGGAGGQGGAGGAGGQGGAGGGAIDAGSP